MATDPCAERLGDELFELVESDQGYSYISDAITELSREDIINTARASLLAHERCARKLRKWLKQEGGNPE